MAQNSQITATPSNTAPKMVLSWVELGHLYNANAVLNPPWVPRGQGRFKWLDDFLGLHAPSLDEEFHAAGLGLKSPVEVIKARLHQNRVDGPNIGQGPHVVFVPKRKYFNPVEQPPGEGYYDYLLDDDRAQARRFVISSALFPINTMPSPMDILWARRLFGDEIAKGEMLEDPTMHINIVWVPIKPSMMPAPIPFVSAPTATPTTARHAYKAEDAISEYNTTENNTNNHGNLEPDPISGLEHQPTNGDVPGGENDQTGAECSRWYQTRIFDNGLIRTVDRATARVNQTNPHKLHVCNNKGVFVAYKHAEGFDWASEDHIKKLNRWREMTFDRQGWPKKRAGREGYEEVEREWLFDLVSKHEGKVPNKRIPDIAEAFNERFPRCKRDAPGISSVLQRMRAEFFKYDGVQKPRGKKRPCDTQGPEESRGKAPRGSSRGMASKGRALEDDDQEDAGQGEDAVMEEVVDDRGLDGRNQNQSLDDEAEGMNY